MRCLYVCTKEVVDRATGYDMPAYVKWPVGAVGWFAERPDPNHWAELEQYLPQLGNEIVQTNKVIYSGSGAIK